MSFPFGWRNWRRIGQEKVFAKAHNSAINPRGRRLLGFTRKTKIPIWAPKGHSLTLAPNGAGKTTKVLMPSLFSTLASSDRPAVLLLDSKDFEIARQVAPMLEEMGVPYVLLDDTGNLPANFPGKVRFNPLSSVVDTFKVKPEDLAFANEAVTHTLIEEPEKDERNRYWRAWPRILISFAVHLLLKRNPDLVTPGGLWSLLSSPQKTVRFAEIEAIEGDGMLKVLAENIIGMSSHEHFPQHLQAAQDALRVYAIGSPLHTAGHQSNVSPGQLISSQSVIFFGGSQANMGSMSTHYGLTLTSFIRAAYQQKKPLWIGADEFTNAPTKQLVQSLTTLRAYQVEVSMIAQSRSEIERKLGRLETQTIDDNCILKQWLGFSYEEAKRVSDAMGEQHAVATSVGQAGEWLKLNKNLSLIRQKWMSPAELMALNPNLMLIHIRGLGYYLAETVSQQNVDPYARLIAANDMEGGRLTPDPKIWLTLPEEARP
ncbi:MAG: TraM recognition domain-containing protein [Pseudomonadota bacterium]